MESSSLGAEGDLSIEFRGGRLVSAIPLFVFVAWAIVQSGVLRVGDTTGLVVRMLVGLILGLFLVRGSWADYADAILDGMTRRVAATAVVAWLWAGMFAETIQVGGFVSGLVWAAEALNVGAALFPAAIFLLAGLLATGIGTGYGTTVAFTALLFPAGVLLGANPTLLFGAILSGAVFGDNLAPVSNTTIVSAVTQDADVGGVVASRFKYAVVAAVLTLAAYVVVGASTAGTSVSADAARVLVERANLLGLAHLVSMLVVVGTAIAGRYTVEAISWGIVVVVAANLVLGLAPASDMLLLRAPESVGAARALAALPVVETVPAAEMGVGGSLYAGAQGFFPLIVLVLLIVAGAQVMIEGGGFATIQDLLLERVATTVQRAELTMVLGTAPVNAMVT